MPMSQEVRTRVEGGVLTITFNRPERKNAITTAMYRALTDALAGADGDRAVRTAVLEGHESVFTAGNDLEDFLKDPGDDEQSPAFAFVRALAKHDEGADVLQRIDSESSIFRQMLGEPAAKEALSAFLSKRKPDFSML